MSGYVDTVLQPGERVLMTGKLHWIIYGNAIVTLLVAIATFIYGGIHYEDSYFTASVVIAIFFALTAPLLAFNAWFNQWTTEIAVTNRRIIYKHGFIRRDTAEMNIDKVESVIVTQSILGRILDYGTIHVRGTGEGIEHLHKIRAPLRLRSAITAPEK